MAVPTANTPNGVVAGALDDIQFHDSLLQQLQRPPLAAFGRSGTGQRDQLRLGCPVKDAWPGRGRRMLADQDGLEPFFHQLLTGPCHRVDAGIQGRRNLAVTPSFAGFRGVSLQQDACLRQQPGRVFACMYQRVEPLPLIIAELHHIPLHGNLFRDHDASPSLRSHRFGNPPRNQ
jgi:hypothetical protein